MLISRIKLFALLFSLAAFVISAHGSGFERGLWFGYSQGNLMPLMPKSDISFSNGYRAGIGLGYDMVLSHHSMVNFGLKRSAIYNYDHADLQIPNSFLTGIGFSYLYYPIPFGQGVVNAFNARQRFFPYLSLGITSSYWSNNAIETSDNWKGIHLFPDASIGLTYKLGAHALIHAGITARVNVTTTDRELDDLGYQIRVSYDLHLKKQDDMQRAYSDLNRRAARLQERADSVRRELKSEMNKVKYAVSEYEGLLIRMATDIDSLSDKYDLLQETHDDTLSELKKIRAIYNDLKYRYDSIRLNTWDTVSVVEGKDTLHNLKEERYLRKGAYLVLYTGDERQITNGLYREISREYEKVWLIQNDFGIRRVMIWLPTEKVDETWNSLLVSFPDLMKFKPVLR